MKFLKDLMPGSMMPSKANFKKTITLRNPKETQGVLRNPKEPLNTRSDLKEYQGTLINSKELKEHLETLRNPKTF